jgi:hypothetical protein
MITVVADRSSADALVAALNDAVTDLEVIRRVSS